METPAVPGMVGAPGGMTPDQWHADKAAREMYERNRPLSDEELDAMLPGAEQVRSVGGGQAGQERSRSGILSPQLHFVDTAACSSTIAVASFARTQHGVRG
jgi:hypothetical protein